MLRHLALFVGAAFLLAACKITVVESPDHHENAGPDGPRKAVAWSHQAGPAARGSANHEGAKSVRGQRAVEVFQSVGPDGGEKALSVRRMAGDRVAKLDLARGFPAGPFGAGGCEAACAMMKELCGKCTQDACLAALECARNCCNKDAKGDDAEAGKLACLRACATAAAECKSCRKAMARCAAACANAIAGGMPGAMMFGGIQGMPGMPANLEHGDLVVTEGMAAAECCPEGACEITCEVGEGGEQRITINGKEMKLDGEAIKLDGATFTVEGAKLEVEGGAPVDGHGRTRIMRLAHGDGPDAKTLVVREITEGGEPKVFSGTRVMKAAGDPKKAIEAAEHRIVEVKEALKAAEEKLATAGDDRPKLEKELNRLREKLEGAKKHIEALRQQMKKHAEVEKKAEGEKKAQEETMKVISGRIDTHVGG